MRDRCERVGFRWLPRVGERDPEEVGSTNERERRNAFYGDPSTMPGIATSAVVANTGPCAPVGNASCTSKIISGRTAMREGQ
jgi:hypothetical protein